MKRLSHLSEFRKRWGALPDNWMIRWAHRLTILSIVLAICLIVWRWRYLPQDVPFWYSLPWGTERLANRLWLFLLPGGSTVIYLINTIISAYQSKGYLLFIQMLALASLLVSILSLITLMNIVFLVS